MCAVKTILRDQGEVLGTQMTFVDLHSMLLTISPFMFWDDPKIFFEFIFSSLVLDRNEITGLPSAVLKNHSK